MAGGHNWTDGELAFEAISSAILSATLPYIGGMLLKLTIQCQPSYTRQQERMVTRRDKERGQN
ncbi:hypothetical protein BT69DRAFT_1281105 [Atractiella rhizophila]|nr:hypothetical protein BT69DRAFT_1284792 [Atractiella rhizophila]KAH8923806.1 hypothetical protein BT69DRAFT_1281105 [Atractiella rhizophila]